MNAVVISSEQFDQLITRIDHISKQVQDSSGNKSETYLNTKQLTSLLKISARTAQSWRDEGIIAFSQVGSKIYYKMSDVEKTMQEHYNRSFAKK